MNTHFSYRITRVTVKNFCFVNEKSSSISKLFNKRNPLYSALELIESIINYEPIPEKFISFLPQDGTNSIIQVDIQMFYNNQIYGKLYRYTVYLKKRDEERINSGEYPVEITREIMECKNLRKDQSSFKVMFDTDSSDSDENLKCVCLPFIRENAIDDWKRDENGRIIPDEKDFDYQFVDLEESNSNRRKKGLSILFNDDIYHCCEDDFSYRDADGNLWDVDLDCIKYSELCDLSDISRYIFQSQRD